MSNYVWIVRHNIGATMCYGVIAVLDKYPKSFMENYFSEKISGDFDVVELDDDLIILEDKESQDQLVAEKYEVNKCYTD